MAPDIYLAPLQGITDPVYRSVIAYFFPELKKMFTPFLQTDTHARLGPKSLAKKIPDSQKDVLVVPQLLSKDGERLAVITDLLNSLGFNEVNLNLGCPFPTVTGKGRGSALLPYPARIDKIFEDYFSLQKTPLSVKMRLGFNDSDDWIDLVSVLNRYPLHEVIMHSRHAKQMYAGVPDVERFLKFREACDHKVVYNGDINSVEDFEQLSVKTAKQENSVMIGRGIVRAPFIIQEIREKKALSQKQRANISYQVISLLQENFEKLLSGDVHYLQKMKNIVRHMVEPFNPEKRTFKKIIKCTNVQHFNAMVMEFFISKGAEFHP
ncbi:MAG: tRNA-dihydrouridine synthase family protein [Spirochaetes bacterium]|jgi:tRNA-dihydrouridine synthase B|nr:tRNA-dihydrouridine synthase family protein [Spirochaetota bacterium]